MRRSKRERAAYRKGWESDRFATCMNNPYLDRYGYLNPYLARGDYRLFVRRGQEREFLAWERGRVARMKWREQQQLRALGFQFG